MNILKISTAVLIGLQLLAQSPNTSCFVDPFDGKKYPNLQQHLPTGTVKSGENDTVVYLLTDQDLIGERISVQDLSNYIKLGKTKIIEATKSNKSDFILLIRYDLSAGARNIKLFTSKSVDKAILQAIQDSLESIKHPVVSKQVLFCVQYGIGS